MHPSPSAMYTRSFLKPTGVAHPRDGEACAVFVSAAMAGVPNSRVPAASPPEELNRRRRVIPVSTTSSGERVSPCSIWNPPIVVWPQNSFIRSKGFLTSRPPPHGASSRRIHSFTPLGRNAARVTSRSSARSPSFFLESCSAPVAKVSRAHPRNQQVAPGSADMFEFRRLGEWLELSAGEKSGDVRRRSRPSPGRSRRSRVSRRAARRGG
jgi:hypothetical protein